MRLHMAAFFLHVFGLAQPLAQGPMHKVPLLLGNENVTESVLHIKCCAEVQFSRILSIPEEDSWAR